jgi:hypothetical protein
MFSASVTVQVGDGTTMRFWTNSWLPDGTICAFVPNLFRAVGCRRHNRTIRDAMLNHQWARDITGAPIALVLCEYVHLWEKLEGIQLTPLDSDRFIWKWTESGAYTASLAYRAVLHRDDNLVWCQASLEIGSAARGQILLLACSSWAPVDS